MDGARGGPFQAEKDLQSLQIRMETIALEKAECLKSVLASVEPGVRQILYIAPSRHLKTFSFSPYTTAEQLEQK